jgi:hypothetical protein
VGSRELCRPMTEADGEARNGGHPEPSCARASGRLGSVGHSVAVVVAAESEGAICTLIGVAGARCPAVLTRRARARLVRYGIARAGAVLRCFQAWA